MTEVIYKYPLQQKTELVLPEGSEILSVQQQDDEVFLWAKIDPSREEQYGNRQRYFICVMTGEPLPDGKLSFVGTVHSHGGKFVQHVFEYFNV